MPNRAQKWGSTRKRTDFNPGIGETHVGRRLGNRTPSVDVRVVAVALVHSGLSAASVGTRLGVSPSTVGKWSQNFRKRGTDGLRTRTAPGKRPRVSAAELSTLLREALAEPPRNEWKPLSTRELAKRIGVRVDVSYDVDHLVRRLRPLLSGSDRSLPVLEGLKSGAGPYQVGMSTPTLRSRSSLDEAIRKKDLAAVRLLLEKDPGLVRSRNSDGLSPVMVAVYCGATEVARDLVARAPTDIFEATCLGDVPRVDHLLSQDGALVAAYSADGWTALHLAAHTGQPQVARLLLSRGAKVDAVSRNGIANQPLQAAIAGREPELVRILIEAGADANHRSHGGFTAAHLAAENGSLEVLELLKKAKADLGAKAEGGKTPLDLAREGHHDKVARWLEKGITRT